MAYHRRRSAHRKSASRRHRKTHRRQHGGGSCAAMPLNRTNFQQQGGMAPVVEGDNYLLDAAARTSAQVGSLDAAFAELPSVIPRQAGGKRRSYRRKSHRKAHRKVHRKSHRKVHRKSHRRSHRQRGGALANIADSSMLTDDISKTGSNPQFMDESAVNPHYGVKGPQA